MSTFKIGCIADDFTGAGDAASFLAAGGMKTLMLIWPHVEAAVTDGYDAVVVALKIRSIAPELAVAESLAAVNWLLERGNILQILLDLRLYSARKHRPRLRRHS